MLKRRLFEITLSGDAMPIFNRLKVFADNDGIASEAMSSHWRHFSKNSVCFADGKTVKFKTIGLDDYRNNDLINMIKNIPSEIYLNKLCKKLPRNILEAMSKICKDHNRTVSFTVSNRRYLLVRYWKVMSN